MPVGSEDKNPAVFMPKPTRYNRHINPGLKRVGGEKMPEVMNPQMFQLESDTHVFQRLVRTFHREHRAAGLRLSILHLHAVQYRPQWRRDRQAAGLRPLGPGDARRELQPVALNVFFETNGMREWQFAAIADRRLVNRLERELAEATRRQGGPDIMDAVTVIDAINGLLDRAGITDGDTTQRRVITLIAQRDALLEACEWARENLGKHTRPSPLDTAIAIAKAAAPSSLPSSSNS